LTSSVATSVAVVESSSTVEPLTDQEIEALSSAGAWYAKYHARIIAERADDGSAYAVAQRERYHHLLDALRKLGIKLRNPVGEGDQRAVEASGLDREAA